MNLRPSIAACQGLITRMFRVFVETPRPATLQSLTSGGGHLGIIDTCEKPLINYELGGKVSVVTRAASGIGLAYAHALARSGAAVALWDMDAQSLQRAVAQLRAYGGQTSVAVVDVGDAVDAAMATIVQNHGRLDMAVSNVGIGGEQSSSGDYGTDCWGTGDDGQPRRRLLTPSGWRTGQCARPAAAR